MESEVSNAGFLYGAWEEGFHPIISTIKTKRALSLIFLNLHFELAKNVCYSLLFNKLSYYSFKIFTRF